MRYAETVDLKGGAELVVRNAVTQGSRNAGAIPGGTGPRLRATRNSYT
jgi:hypothetical protein